MLDLVLRNVRLPGGRVVDIEVEGGRVVHIGAGGHASTTLDCTGLVVLPGAIDMHVHLRGGAQAQKEDWRTGTRSALAGGVTMVVDQPNTDPPLDTVDCFRARVDGARKESLCAFGVNAAVTPTAEIEDLHRAGALAFGEVFVAPSSYGEALDDDVLRDALTRIGALGGLATLHLEEIGPGDVSTLEEHDRCRPPDGEVRALDRVLALAPRGVRLHCCHMTSPNAIRRAHRTGATVEVTPHHLLLDRDRYRSSDARGRVNPPLRTRAEVERLGICIQLVDALASDHAPHTEEEKARPFAEAPSGLPGVETMVPLMLARVLNRKMTVPRLIDLTVDGPARILGVPAPGFRAGDRADFACYRPVAEPIVSSRLHSRCGWTPYEGMPAVFPERVIRAGEVAYEFGDYSGVPGEWFTGNGFII
jgi:dihydroorotase